MIISVHIRKCAGTSFRRSIEDHFTDSVLFDYGDEIGSTWPSSVAKRRFRLERAVQGKADLQSSYSIIHGHFYRKKYDFLDGTHRYITFLRDPVERVLSNYYYLKRNIDRKNPDALVVNALGFSLTEFAQYSDNRNLQSQYIQSETLDDFDFVGVVSQYEDSIKKLNGILGSDLRQTDRHNTNAEAGTDYEVEPKVRTIIENCNTVDLRLYDQALNKLSNIPVPI